MVFFVCEGCNETLKKNQVDRHAQRCSSCYAVTCVDCQVTFPGDDYAAHTTCISEAEKYEKSIYKGKKEKSNPQEQWSETIQLAAAQVQKAPQHIQPFIVQLADCPNVPRNEKKFMNFAKNSLRIHSPATLQSIWQFIIGMKVDPPQALSTAVQPPTATDAKRVQDIIEIKIKSEEREHSGEKKKKKKKDKYDESDKGDEKVKSKKRKATEVEECALQNSVERGTALEKKVKKKKKEKSKE